MSAAAAQRTRPDRPLQAFLRARIKPGERLFGVVDAARGLELAEAAKDRSDFTRSHGTLMRGPLAPFVQHVAPHLVEIDIDTTYVDTWAGSLGQAAGILLVTSAAPAELAAHLRSLFVVTDEAGEKYSFRFYDPRVTRLFLPTCDETQLREFFGPVRLVIVESTQRGTLLVYHVGGECVQMAIEALPSPARRS
ncbi:MAG: DUF4123 domain-containing protein [Phycisphaerae bacterium]